MTLAPLASLLLLAATPTNKEQAATFFHQSATEYELGNFEEALAAIAKAYRLDPRPALLFNLGQCHRALHHWERAAFFYDEYLAKTPTAPNRGVVEQLVVEMKANLRAERAAGPPPADVNLFGGPAPVPTAPLPSKVPPPEPVAVAPPAPTAAPEAATTVMIETASPSTHSHGLGATLATAAAVCAGFAIYGAVRVVEYQQIPTQTTNWTQYNQAVGLNYQNTQNWGTAAIILGIAAAGGITGAIFTW